MRGNGFVAGAPRGDRGADGIGGRAGARPGGERRAGALPLVLPGAGGRRRRGVGLHRPAAEHAPRVVRNGQLIGATNGGPGARRSWSFHPSSQDVANLYAGAALRRACYDGKPTIPNPCVGSRVFTAPGATERRRGRGRLERLRSLGVQLAVSDDENPFTVTLRYRLAATDHVYASTYQELPAVGVSSYLERGVSPCPPPPVVNPPAPSRCSPSSPRCCQRPTRCAVRGPAQPGHRGPGSQAALRRSSANARSRSRSPRPSRAREVHAERLGPLADRHRARSPSRRPARATSRCA